jgi:hypothetical protein
VINKALNEYKPRNIIELGYGRGGVTLLLGFYAFMHGGRVDSFDILRQPAYTVKHVFPITFHRADVFAERTQKTIISLITSPLRSLLYCDNGDKVEEFNTYGRHLKPGDIAVIHDRDSPKAKEMGYACEVSEAMIEGTMSGRFKAVYEDEIEKAGGGLFILERY